MLEVATVVGNWVRRHLSWDNPFVNAPLPYENITSTADHEELPESAGEFLESREYARGRPEWVPVVWGPSYAGRFAVMG